MARDFKKETEWEKTAYKRYVFKCRIPDEVEKLTKVLNERPFSEWLREHLKTDYENLEK